MASVNKVILIGHLGKDPEINTTQSGFMIVVLSVATNNKTKNKTTGDTKEETEWHRIVLMNHSAEFAKNYLKKGMKVFIEGRLRTRKWTDAKQIERYTTEVIGEAVLSLERASDNRAPEPPSLNEDDIPF